MVMIYQQPNLKSVPKSTKPFSTNKKKNTSTWFTIPKLFVSSPRKRECCCGPLTDTQKKWTLVSVIVFVLLSLVVFLVYWFAIHEKNTETSSINDTNDSDSKLQDAEEIEIENSFLPLGRTINLSKQGIYEVISGGTTVFPESMKACFEKSALPMSKIELSSFSSSAQMAATTSSGLNVNFSKKGLAGTLQTVYGHQQISYRLQTAVLIDYFVPRATIKVNEECMKQSQLQSSLLRDLDALPEDIGDPRNADHWKAYDHFLSVYGSHVVTGVDLGARMVTWIVTKIVNTGDLHEMKMNACAQFSILSESIGGCVHDASNHAKISLSDSYNKKIFILGGSKKTRDQLVSNHTLANLQTFLNSAKAETPARYSYLPIWTLLRKWLAARHAVPEKKLKILRNLEAYYEGYLNSNCHFIQGHDDHILRQFVLSNGRYVCENRVEGCITDNDCRFVLKFPEFWDSTCRCPSCIRQEGEDRVPVSISENHPIEARSYGCRVNQGLNQCDCHNHSRMEIIWP